MNRKLPVRKSNRLQGYDYSKAGCYFITICVKDGHEMLGKIVGATAPGRPFVELTPLGRCVEETIQNANRDGQKIDKYVIMPNHIHMILIINPEAGDRGRSPLQYIVRNIKSYVTKWAGFSPWQKSFHDHIIRDDAEYRRIWKYIDENPAKWQEDCYYVKRIGDNMNIKIKKLIGSNMDIDFSNADFGNSECPWNVEDNTNVHKCAVKSTSICKYFCGIQYLDSVLCSYPHENLSVLTVDEVDRDMKR